ncbi:MAG: hypothetical protein ACRDN9_10610 [Streptosporangiaceae bacterium]
MIEPVEVAIPDQLRSMLGAQDLDHSVLLAGMGADEHAGKPPADLPKGLAEWGAELDVPMLLTSGEQRSALSVEVPQAVVDVLGTRGWVADRQDVQSSAGALTDRDLGAGEHDHPALSRFRGDRRNV